MHLKTAEIKCEFGKEAVNLRVGFVRGMQPGNVTLRHQRQSGSKLKSSDLLSVVSVNPFSKRRERASGVKGAAAFSAHVCT